MMDYKQFLKSINTDVYHKGEHQWQEGDCTVTRANRSDKREMHWWCLVRPLANPTKRVFMQSRPELCGS